MGNAFTKYGRVETELRSRIVNGHYGKVGKIPPEMDLAKEFGVSYLTARRAVCNLVDRGLLERRHRRGTFVRTRPSATNVGLLAFHAQYEYQMGMPRYALDCLTKWAEAEGRRVRAQLMPAVLPDPDQAVAELETMQVGAVGVLGFLEEDRNFILRLGERLPVVLFHKPLEGSNLPYTMPDMRKAAQLASEFLARQGRRRIASGIGFCGHSARERLAADVRIEIEYHGIQWNDKYGFAPGNYETEPDETKEWIDRMLTDDPIPDAFLLYNNVAAEHLASELGKRRLTVGKDVDIVAFISSRGQPETAITWPTVLLNYPDSTLLASEMLQEALLSGAVPQPLQRFSKPSFKVPETR